MNNIIFPLSGIRYHLRTLLYALQEFRYKLKYPDYDPNYDALAYHYIWSDNPNGNIGSENNIELGYNRDRHLYSLSVETAYLFETKHEECEYLKRCLERFTEYVNSNGIGTEFTYPMFLSDLSLPLTAKTISEIYISFKVFVLGFCALYDT